MGHGDECKDFLWFGQMDGNWGRNSLCHIGGDLNWFSVRLFFLNLFDDSGMMMILAFVAQSVCKVFVYGLEMVFSVCDYAGFLKSLSFFLEALICVLLCFVFFLLCNITTPLLFFSLQARNLKKKALGSP